MSLGMIAKRWDLWVLKKKPVADDAPALLSPKTAVKLARRTESAVTNKSKHDSKPKHPMESVRQLVQELRRKRNAPEKHAEASKTRESPTVQLAVRGVSPKTTSWKIR